MRDYCLSLYEKALPETLSWPERLSFAREAGFDQVEISIDESENRLRRLQWDDEAFRLFRQAVEDTGVPVRTMCLSGHRKYPLGSHDPAVRARGMEILTQAVDFACRTGVRLIQLAGYDVYYEEGDATTRAYFAENLEKGVLYAAKQGVILGFETMETPFMDTISKGMEYVDRIHSPYLGMYPDLGNLTNAAYKYGLNVTDEINRGQGHIFAMHLKETREGVYRDMDFGTGRVDFVSGIRAALRCGVRLFNAEFWHDGRAAWRDQVKDAADFLHQQFEKAANLH